MIFIIFKGLSLKLTKISNSRVLNKLILVFISILILIIIISFIIFV